MADISFEDFVDQQVAEAEQAQSMDWPQRREDWINHLNKFYELALGFLEKYIEEEKIHIRWATKRINEDFIGNYDVKSLEVSIGAVIKIHFDPIGTNLIGAKGRVDMHGPHGTVRFVLVPKTDSSPSPVTIQDEPKPQAMELKTLKETSDIKYEDCVWKISTRPPNIKYIELEEESFLSAVMEVANA